MKLLDLRGCSLFKGTPQNFDTKKGAIKKRGVIFSFLVKGCRGSLKIQIHNNFDPKRKRALKKRGTLYNDFVIFSFRS